MGTDEAVTECRTGDGDDADRLCDRRRTIVGRGGAGRDRPPPPQVAVTRAIGRAARISILFFSFGGKRGGGRELKMFARNHFVYDFRTFKFKFFVSFFFFFTKP